MSTGGCWCFANENQYSLLPAAFGGTINLELWKADKAFCLLILWSFWKKKNQRYEKKKPDGSHEYCERKCLHLLIHVPVQTRVFQDEPIFLPLLWEIGFSILLFPQPALAVPLTQVPAGYPPLTDGRYGTSTCRWQKKVQTSSKQNTRPLGAWTFQQSLVPLLFFFDLDLIEDRSKTCDEIRK